MMGVTWNRKNTTANIIAYQTHKDLGPGFRRPILVIQGNPFNESKISTVVCIPLTSNLKWAIAPGDILLKKRVTGLAKDSVADICLRLFHSTKAYLRRIPGSSLRQIFMVPDVYLTSSLFNKQ